MGIYSNDLKFKIPVKEEYVKDIKHMDHSHSSDKAVQYRYGVHPKKGTHIRAFCNE